MSGVPDDKKASLIPKGFFDAWADATFATDPDGAKRNPPMIRVPNGVMADVAETFWAGKGYYDPGKITVPGFWSLPPGTRTCRRPWRALCFRSWSTRRASAWSNSTAARIT
jgi:hypothetical protein